MNSMIPSSLKKKNFKSAKVNMSTSISADSTNKYPTLNGHENTTGSKIVRIVGL